MSRIDDLIADLCPDGVPHKPLGKVGTFIRGNGLQKTDLTDNGTPAIHYGQVHTHYGVWATTTKSFTDPALAARLRRAEPGDLIIATTSEDDAAVAKATAWIGQGEVAVSGDAYIYRHVLEPRYVAYFFQSEHFQDQKVRYITGAKVRRVSGDSLAKIHIPVPPLEVQREIVRILDQFTRLEAELEAELEARRAQYAHYRDALVVEESAPDWIALGDVAEFKYGYTHKARAEGDYRFVRITDINPQGKLSLNDARFVDASSGADQYLVKPGDLLVARTGATYGKTVLMGDIDRTVYASFLIRVRFKEGTLLPGYYWHFAQSEMYWRQARALVGGGAQPQFNANVLKMVRVPVPAPEEQQRVVDILDSFDLLVNDLSSGLPAELAARRKQYAYYRDRLLTFKEAV